MLKAIQQLARVLSTPLIVICSPGNVYIVFYCSSCHVSVFFEVHTGFTSFGWSSRVFSATFLSPRYVY